MKLIKKKKIELEKRYGEQWSYPNNVIDLMNVIKRLFYL